MKRLLVVVRILMIFVMMAIGAVIALTSLPTGFRRRILNMLGKEAADSEPPATLFLLWVLLVLAACPWVTASFGDPLPSELSAMRTSTVTSQPQSREGAGTTKTEAITTETEVTTLPEPISSVSRAPTPTSTPMPTPTHSPTPTPTPTHTPTSTSTSTPTPTRTPTLTPTPTRTPTPEVNGLASGDLRVYSCPSKESRYATSHRISRGKQVKVLGWNEDRDTVWYLVRDDGVGTQQWWVAASDGLGVTPSNYRQYLSRVTCRKSSTPTPTSVPVSAIDPNFRADRISLGAGECTHLHWDVDHVKAVYLDGAGRPGHSKEQVCPPQTHTYELKVKLNDGQEKSFYVKINVSGSLPLGIDYEIRNVWCPGTHGYSVEFYVRAQGGRGRYTYYRDIDGIGGPTTGAISYRLDWAKCGGVPGTFLVKSEDGQEAQKTFWVDPPGCCKK